MGVGCLRLKTNVGELITGLTSLDANSKPSSIKIIHVLFFIIVAHLCSILALALSRGLRVGTSILINHLKFHLDESVVTTRGTVAFRKLKRTDPWRETKTGLDALAVGFVDISDDLVHLANCL